MTTSSTSAAKVPARVTSPRPRKGTDLATRLGPRRSRRGSLPSGVVRTTVMFGLGVYFFLPLYWLAISSTKSTSDLFGSGGLWFAHPQLAHNLSNLSSYDSHIYWRWTFNSVLYAGVGSTVATLLATMAGYSFAKQRFRGRNLLFSLVLTGVLVPSTALALPLYLLAAKIGMVNDYWAVLIPSFVAPFGVYLARVYVDQSIPDELLEAATVDGAGQRTIFLEIVLPILRPALVTIFLFQFISIWNNFFLPLVMLSSQSLYPVTLGLQEWSGRADRETVLYSLIVVGSLVSVIPLLIAVLLLQRFWRSGLTSGSVKT